MKSERLTRDQLADRFGVDPRTITNWVQEGMPQRTKSGKPVYAWGECRDWREKKIREDARANREAGGSEDRKTQMAEARLRTALAEAEAAELDLAERRGQLVTVDFMRGEFERIGHALRARLLAMPPAWAARLGACVTTVDRQLALQDAVNELLPVLQDLVDDDEAGEELAAAEKRA
ncbi:MAG: terminase small subunit [Kofleriaceae bacterium]